MALTVQLPQVADSAAAGRHGVGGRRLAHGLGSGSTFRHSSRGSASPGSAPRVDVQRSIAYKEDIDAARLQLFVEGGPGLERMAEYGGSSGE